MTADDHVFTCRMTGKHGPKPEAKTIFSDVINCIYNTIEMEFWNFGLFGILEFWISLQFPETTNTTGLRQVNDRFTTG